MKITGNYLLALRCSTTNGLEGGGFERVKDIGRAANAATARNPSSITAGVHSHEQSLRWSPNIGPHNVRGALNDLSSGRNGDDRFLNPGEAGQELEPGLVLGQRLEHVLLPGRRTCVLCGSEGGAWTVEMEDLEVRAVVVGGAAFGVWVVEGLGS